jgi:hypothetical protein
MTLRKVVSSALLLSTSLYILLPTPDELVIYPVLGLFLSIIFHMPFVYGVLLSMIIYRAVGGAFLFGAFMVGCKTVYRKFKEKIGKKGLTDQSW